MEEKNKSDGIRYTAVVNYIIQTACRNRTDDTIMTRVLKLQQNSKFGRISRVTQFDLDCRRIYRKAMKLETMDPLSFYGKIKSIVLKLEKLIKDYSMDYKTLLVDEILYLKMLGLIWSPKISSKHSPYKRFKNYLNKYFVTNETSNESFIRKVQNLNFEINNMLNSRHFLSKMRVKYPKESILSDFMSFVSKLSIVSDGEELKNVERYLNPNMKERINALLNKKTEKNTDELEGLGEILKIDLTVKKENEPLAEESLKKDLLKREENERGSDFKSKRRMKWSDEETQSLLEGVEKHGVGNWSSIRSDINLSISPRRTAINLKDRWRVLLKNNLISEFRD